MARLFSDIFEVRLSKLGMLKWGKYWKLERKELFKIHNLINTIPQSSYQNIIANLIARYDTQNLSCKTDQNLLYGTV